MTEAKIATKAEGKEQGSLDFTCVDELFLLLNRYRFKVWEMELQKLCDPQKVVNLLNAVEARIRQASFRGTKSLTDAELRTLSEMCSHKSHSLREQNTQKAREAQQRITAQPWLAPRLKHYTPGHKPEGETADVSGGHKHNASQRSTQQSHHRRRTKRAG